MVSPFEVLDVAPDDDEETIERAYRDRIKQAHPDQGGSVEEFQLVRRAYTQLLDRERNGDGDLDADAAPDIDLGDDAGTPRAGTQVRVEFLNYAVVEDHGWSLDDADLFAKASGADLAPEDYGRLLADPSESLLEAAENRGYSWPFSCRGGACANCAVLLVDGELSQPANHVLPEELSERGFRLSCNGYPITDELKIVFNVKHLPELDELMLPPGPFSRTRTK